MNLIIEFNNKTRNISYELNEDGCWICTSHKPKIQRNGTPAYYSIKGFNGRVVMIHQMIFVKFFGEYDKALSIRHKCDNPLCINPEHLELGTQADNMRDLFTRKAEHMSEINKGNKYAKTKLNEEMVKEIRNKYSSGNITQKQLAEEYNVSRQLIQKVVKNEIWKD